MASVIKSVSFDAADALALARFWAAALGSDVDEDSTDGRAFVEAAGWGGPNVWFNQVVPRLGAALSDPDAYRYLPRSVAYLPPGPVLRRILTEVGYSGVGIRPLAGGLSQLLLATRAG